MKFDFSVGAKLSQDTAVLYNAVAKDQREEFHLFIEQLSVPNSENLDWWVSGPASRNTLASSLFHFFCCFKLLEQQLKKQKAIEGITVDSVAFYEIIRHLLLKENVNVPLFLCATSKNGFYGRLIFYLRIKRQIAYFIKQAYNAKRTRKSYVEKHTPKIDILVDTFVFPEWIEHDRTYTGLWEHLSPDEQKKVFFVPNLYGFKGNLLYQTYQKIRSSKRNFLLKEDFLGFTDYFHAFKYALRIKKLEIPATHIDGIDFSKLIKEELNSLVGFSSSVLGILNYRFAKRLKKKGISLRKVINRFENQVIDKGWNKGFNEFYPETLSIGYQGFIMSTHYLCMYPTKMEAQSNLLPSKIAVIGNGHIKAKQEFYSKIDFITAPALRFKGVWEDRKFHPKKGNFTMLIALPISLSDAISTLSLLFGTINLNIISTQNLEIWVKPHPTMSPERIKSAFKEDWPSQFKFISGDFNEYVEQSNLFLGNLSSTCLETLAKGIPVIVVGNPNGLTHNPIPLEIKKDIWKLAQTAEELANAINFYQKCTKEEYARFNEIGKKIRDDYFEPVTPDGVR